MRDHYEVLEVHPNASPEVIKRAYRVLAEKFHPDRQPPEARAWANERMQELNRAYTVLGDEQRRRSYDLAQTGGESLSLGSMSARVARISQLLFLIFFVIGVIRMVPGPMRLAVLVGGFVLILLINPRLIKSIANMLRSSTRSD